MFKNPVFIALILAFPIVTFGGGFELGRRWATASCCGSADCGCDHGDCCSSKCCTPAAEPLPMPRVVPSSEAAR